jgi:hypothetical protein
VSAADLARLDELLRAQRLFDTLCRVRNAAAAGESVPPWLPDELGRIVTAAITVIAIAWGMTPRALLDSMLSNGPSDDEWRKGLPHFAREHVERDHEKEGRARE